MAVVRGTNCGFVSVSPVDDPSGNNATQDGLKWSTWDTSPAGVNNIIEMGWWCETNVDETDSTVDFDIGWYSHDADNSRPNVRLDVSADCNLETGAGWKKITDLSWDIENAETTHWVAVQLDDTATTTQHNMSIGDSGDAYYNTDTSLPNPFGNGSATNRLVAVYALYEAAGGSSYDETISEKINLADTQRAGMIYGMSIREVTNLGESLGPQAVYNVSRSETLSMLDAVKAGILIALRVNETISLRDIEIAQAVFSPHVREQIGLTEQIKGQFVFTPQVGERISLADAITAGFLFNLNLNEVASLTDAVIAELVGGAQIFNESLNERISIADSVTAILQFYADIRESVSLSETVKSASILNLSLRDFLSLRDQAAEGVRIFFDTITEKLSLSDNVAAMFIHALALSESISVADSNKAQLTFNLSVTDHIQLTDVLAAIFKFGLIVTENLTVGDIVVGTVTPATITIARGKTFIFSVDIGKATGGIAAKKGAPDIKKFH